MFTANIVCVGCRCLCMLVAIANIRIYLPFRPNGLILVYLYTRAHTLVEIVCAHLSTRWKSDYSVWMLGETTTFTRNLLTFMLVDLLVWLRRKATAFSSIASSSPFVSVPWSSPRNQTNETKATNKCLFKTKNAYTLRFLK